MMKWLSGRGFDPARQPAAYLALCGDSEAEPNDVTVETLAASREYVYIPGTANELSGARVTENERDAQACARRAWRAPLHSVRAFRLASVRADGCRGLGQSTADPRTADVSGERGGLPRLRLRQLYCCQRHNRADARPRLFWEDYDDSNDGIYSAVSRVREVLRGEMTYTETPSEAPGGEDPARVVSD